MKWVEPKKGQWDMRQKQFKVGVEIQSWAVVNFVQENACGDDQQR